ncbi:MAG: hypothetical protein LBN08_07260 [Lactobacillales bacterium]|jgi:hypothetical protein|nr:hypothetical protein [Lactobacillales bacterium]
MTMTKKEALKRMATELEIPLLNLNLPLQQETFTEEEYLKLKKDFGDYFENYVRNIEH